MLRLALVLLMLLTLPLRANLGESVEQCVKRYGKPIGFSEASAKSPFGTVVFAAGGYTLVVFVVNNEEVGARVTKGDKSAFSDAELKNIMSADANSAWEISTTNVPNCTQWIRSDKATALYDRDNHVLMFMTLTMQQTFKTEPTVTTGTH